MTELRHLLFQRSRDIPVTSGPCPLPLGRRVHTMWMSQPCRWSSMNGTFTPYDLVRAVPE